MRGNRGTDWRVQFDRAVRASSAVYEWAHTEPQTATDQVIYAGFLRAPVALAPSEAARPVIWFDRNREPGWGGSTSRIGGDFSLPITRTASFFGTIHPDYSNVELDQQTIAPTVFPRQFNEVRPFFTQGSQFYNSVICHDCVDFPFLYTPAIPTPREGYAIEGVQGTVHFGGFEAISARRTDAGAVGRVDFDRSTLSRLGPAAERRFSRDT